MAASRPPLPRGTTTNGVGSSRRKSSGCKRPICDGRIPVQCINCKRTTVFEPGVNCASTSATWVRSSRSLPRSRRPLPFDQVGEPRRRRVGAAGPGVERGGSTRGRSGSSCQCQAGRPPGGKGSARRRVRPSTVDPSSQASRRRSAPAQARPPTCGVSAAGDRSGAALVFQDEKTSSRSSSKPASSGERSVCSRPMVCVTASTPTRWR